MISTAVNHDNGPHVSYFSVSWVDLVRNKSSHHSQAFHTQHQRIWGHVSRVAQRILFPKLAEEVLHARHLRIIVYKVSLEEDVDGAGYDGSAFRCHLGDFGALLRTNHRAFHWSESFNAGLAWRLNASVMQSNRVHPVAKVRMSLGTVQVFSMKLPERSTPSGK